jgi:hypothetical protein
MESLTKAEESSRREVSLGSIRWYAESSDVGRREQPFNLGEHVFL